jgi:hypothetical protein
VTKRPIGQEKTKNIQTLEIEIRFNPIQVMNQRDQVIQHKTEIISIFRSLLSVRGVKIFIFTHQGQFQTLVED